MLSPQTHSMGKKNIFYNKEKINPSPRTDIHVKDVTCAKLEEENSN